MSGWAGATEWWVEKQKREGRCKVWYLKKEDAAHPVAQWNPEQCTYKGGAKGMGSKRGDQGVCELFAPTDVSSGVH